MAHRTGVRSQLVVLAFAATAQGQPVGERLALPEAAWRERLNPAQYRVLREHATEPAFHNAYWDQHAAGLYRCAGCGAPLFAADAKYDSGTGWPSFTRPVEPGRIGTTRDDSAGMTRIEVHCARCGGHLGHVFDDGPAPAGLRYCINSAALAFQPASPAGGSDRTP